jgi:hypothetical protein
MLDGLLLFVCSLRSIADGSGSSGHGSPLAGTRGPTTATLWLSVRCRWRPVAPEAVKTAVKKTAGYDGESLCSEAHRLPKAPGCVRLLFCEALRAKSFCAGRHA